MKFDTDEQLVCCQRCTARETRRRERTRSNCGAPSRAGMSRFAHARRHFGRVQEPTARMQSVLNPTPVLLEPHAAGRQRAMPQRRSSSTCAQKCHTSAILRFSRVQRRRLTRAQRTYPQLLLTLLLSPPELWRVGVGTVRWRGEPRDSLAHGNRVERAFPASGDVLARAPRQHMHDLFPHRRTARAHYVQHAVVLLRGPLSF
mmetsp:Transcript_10145/g.27095  ORF Transcript_10145/g.27095 Transcript_10145/m.27095 type:complete len:202 (-) Transcript_10145:221-826(-)